MEKRIYIKTWLEFKPYAKQTATDIYYLKLCNNVKYAITTSKHSLVIQRHFDKEDINYLSCFLTSYFEDLISGTNIWNSFVSIHQRLYRKPLPFYILDEYYEEEINPQDISFLIWYYFNTIQEEKFISPYSNFIVETADKVMDVFDEAWDYAPENKYLKTFYQINENERDYYIARNLIDTILFKSYLFYPDTLLKLKEEELEMIKEKTDEENIFAYLNEIRDAALHTSYTRLLSLKGKEWAAELLSNKHPLSSDLLNISQKIQGYFLYKGQDDKDIFLEHIASDKKFKITKKSFDDSTGFNKIDSIVFMGIVQWRGEWWFSGVFFQQPFNANLILDEKNSIESRMSVSFLDYQKIENDKLIHKQLKAFKDFNNGSQIVFLPSEKIDYFVRSFTEYYNKTLNLSAKEKEEAKQRAKKNGLFDLEKEHKDYSEISETGLVFFNHKSGIEVALGVNSAFPLDKNPFFELDQSKKDIVLLLMSEEMSPELALYCIDNCKTNLPFFNNNDGKLYLEDIDFLLRFWKKGNYHSKPSIAFTGQVE